MDNAKIKLIEEVIAKLDALREKVFDETSVLIHSLEEMKKRTEAEIDLELKALAAEAIHEIKKGGN